MKEKILVVGGYGKIGTEITRLLVNKYNYKLKIGGRDIEKALVFAKSFDQNVDAVYIEPEIQAPDEIIKILRDVKMVIVTFDLPNTAFSEICVKEGTDYIDITPTFEIMKSIYELNAVAKKYKSLGLLSVGLSPGLTNLVVKDVLVNSPQSKEIEIITKFGSGDTAGFQSFWWSFSNLNSIFKYYSDGKAIQTRSFKESKKYKFHGDSRSRRVYRFNFPEQQTLPMTLNIPTISYWLCYESKLDTFIISKLKWVFRSVRITHRLAKYYSQKVSGKETFQTEIHVNGEERISIIGSNQGKLTAGIVAVVTNLIYSGKFNHGVYHIDELLSLVDVEEVFTDFDIRIKRSNIIRSKTCNE